ncbi:unnamed protein product [Darwinula stevensoni]|uniref:PAT complex subunit CCDC47 n=1 Tax=Darwinula stevensoni TaxID=69355 RepID=A0A7R8X6Y6_9CRUS|nr:unnamed protein product [Darwinula stevensoni]CAG0881756.1 unnamed protein product [Darwinula stevensoni]
MEADLNLDLPHVLFHYQGLYQESGVRRVRFWVPQVHGEDAEDNDVEDSDFADFEEFDSEESRERRVPSAEKHHSKQGPASDSKGKENINDEVQEEEGDEASVEEEDELEYSDFHDEEEFEGFEGGAPTGKSTPHLTIAKVPASAIGSRWDSYILEIMMVTGLVIYLTNFMMGRAKNARLAQAWFQSHKSLLEENFVLVGDDGKREVGTSGGEENPTYPLVKESEHIYTLWCSGRQCCEGMLVLLKFLKRQDLVWCISQLVRKQSDRLEIQFNLGQDDMDSFVWCIAQKKTAVRLVKEMYDLGTYCPERRLGEKFGLSSSFILMSEIPEALTSIVDSKVTATLNKLAHMVDYIHVSDQYSGPKNQGDGSSQTPSTEVKKVLICGFIVPGEGQAHDLTVIDSMKPLLQLSFYLLDKLKRFRLSKEGKQKAEKNRAKVYEAQMRQTHAARAEAAAQRREEKRRQEKDRMLQEEDPEKQRRWEEKELRRQIKKKQPKIKQLKVKSL